MTRSQEGPVILIGYEYRLQLEAEADLFPQAAAFAGQVRRAVTEGTVLTTLTSANTGADFRNTGQRLR